MNNNVHIALITTLLISSVPCTAYAQGQARLEITTRTEDAIRISSANNHTWRLGPNSGSGVGFGIFDETAAVTRFTIDLNGRVGIGTTNSQSLLAVAGPIQSTTGGFVFPDGTAQVSAAVGGYSAGAGLQLTGNAMSIQSTGVVSTMLANSVVQTSHIADGAVTADKLAADVLGGVQLVVRGVVVFNGSTLEITQTLSERVDPTKSLVYVSPPIITTSDYAQASAATVIALTDRTITIAIGFRPVSCRVSYQIVQFK